jgi:carbamoyl-phosphate synthase large subunit
VDVDCIADVGLPDGDTVVIGGVLEHIEFAGVHSGDAAMVLPPHTLSKKVLQTIRGYTDAMARELKVIGLMNVQYAVKDGIVYVLEVNPRASRTVPFVSKAIGHPLAKLASKVMTGKTLKELKFTKSVFPFNRFFGVDIILGPEMKSTGEVMGIDADLGLAYAKSQMAAGGALPTEGNVFISVHDAPRTPVAKIAKEYAALGFKLFATEGTARTLEAAKVPVTALFKLSEGRPNVLDMIKNGEIALIINTPSGKAPREDEVRIRTAAVQNRVPIMTTLTGAAAAVDGIASLKKHGVSVCSLQEYHGK